MTTKIVIIGAGPAGEAAARTLRQESTKNGASVDITVVEKEHPGGLCLNKGCIPSKTLLEHVHTRGTLDWATLQKEKTAVVSGIRTALQGTFKRLNVQYIQGRATLKDANSFIVETNDAKQTLAFDKAIIATGTDIFYPPPLDSVKDQLLNSDRLLELEKTPKSVVIVGGGAVGLEFACLLNALGSKVTIIELQNGILPGEDPVIVSQLTRIYESRGMVIKTGVSVKEIKKESHWALVLSNGEKIEAEAVASCVGRKPNLGKLNLGKENLKINDQLQTQNPHIFIAGDAGTTRLAHAAAKQGEIAARNALGAKEKFDDSLTPRCLYSWPEVASIGAWKYQLDEKNVPAKSTRAYFKGSSKALAAGETDGFVQLVSDPTTGKILGAQILGAHATELIHLIAVAMKAGLTTKDLADTMFAHPTLSESIKEAALK